MMRKIQCPPSVVSTDIPLFKEMSHSLSTEESPRQNLPSYLSHKQKSQLCKKFVENGYCPYEKKCKFAHGLHELKKNQQTNSKYKTKTCGGYLQEGFCPYGNRCNFIHPGVQSHNCSHSIDFAFMEIKIELKKQSRLMKLLQ